MIYDQVKKTIEAKKLIAEGDKVLACVSGGPDSMAMLYILSELRNKYRLKLTVAHLDHMLRGRDSAADAFFVRRVAARLKIPCVVERINVKTFAKTHKMSVEEAAREARYNFYGRAAEEIGANKIATGHTMDDQAETVLMRFIKGSGSLGLSGIPYKRRMGGSWIIRPFLDIRRQDIEKYLKRRRLASRTDSSNFKTFYLRNRLRHKLIPLLAKEFNPKITDNLALIAKNLSDEFDFLASVAQRLCKKFVKHSNMRAVIKINDLSRQHVALQRLIARQIIRSIKGDLRGIEYKHWKEIESILYGENKKSADLPGRIKVAKTGGRLVFRTECIQHGVPRSLGKTVKLAIPGNTAISELGVRISAVFVRHAPKFKKRKRRNQAEFIDGDSIGAPLGIRTWRKGDRIRPLGMNSTKKLQDIFVDEKIPKEKRNRIPLVVSGNKILWIAGLKLSDDCKLGDEPKKIIKLTAASLR